MTISRRTEGLLAFLDASPSPYHAVASAVSALTEAGFRPVDAGQVFPAEPGGWFVARGGALVAWRQPEHVTPTAPFAVIGAHTDSPNLRVKPVPDTGAAGYRQLAVDVYGGALVNSWLDRDLGLSGRVGLASGEVRLLNVRRPLLRLAQLAIHLDRNVNESGVALDRQTQLVPIWGLGSVDEDGFRNFLADELHCSPGEIVAWDVMTHDLTPAAVLGADGEFVVSGRLDNLASVYCGLQALIAATGEPPADPNLVPVLVAFDHEEVGSGSDTGAAGPILADVLERSVLARGGGRAEYLAALSGSLCVSCDMAHAVHPNYLERYEPNHRVRLNAGPVVKTNAGMRYASEAPTVARFVRACASVAVEPQLYAHRSNLACGSTIGPITATRLGIATVDVGNPMLSMHSAREMAGAHDTEPMIRALTAVLCGL